MGIITRVSEQKKYCNAALLIPFLVSAPVANAEFTVLPSLASGIVLQDSKTADRQTLNTENITIEPAISLDYKSRLVSATWNAKHQHIIREANDEDVSENFTTYDYTSRVDLIENLLNIQADGGLNVVNLTPGDYLVSDRFLNPDNLSKTRRNRLSLNLESSVSAWVNVSGSLVYSDVDAEERNDSVNNLSGDTYTFRSTLTQGDDIKRGFFSISSLFSATKNDQDNTSVTQQQRSDQKSREIDGIANFQLFGPIGAVVRASNEGYQFDSAANNDSRRDFTSYGAGLSYVESPNRFIAVTLNRGERDEETESYVGGTLNWAFSRRTQLQASYNKRYYGDAGELQFNYNTRTLRASVSYEEQVSNFARLTAEQSSLGVFVCPSNDINISSCYQPNTLNAQLEPGEQFTEFSELVVEVSDEPILIKSGTAVLGYSKTKFSSALEFRYSNPFYENSRREQLTYTTSLSANYELGPKTDLRTQATYIESYERPGTNGIGQRYDDTLVRVLGAISYKINENLIIDSELRFLERDSDVEQRNVQDRRLSFTLKYTF